jgi:DNA-binding transcriptional regulator YdaS (Cro superfamily)
MIDPVMVAWSARDVPMQEYAAGGAVISPALRPAPPSLHSSCRVSTPFTRKEALDHRPPRLPLCARPGKPQAASQQRLGWPRDPAMQE